mmetsp:Transcript_26776/g.75678  ORF Transcript_26776/g.75678 Transcript_26776/m.75678 type:complete len:214 (-) Transcript_26776:65-706(-)
MVAILLLQQLVGSIKHNECRAPEVRLLAIQHQDELVRDGDHDVGRAAVRARTRQRVPATSAAAAWERRAADDARACREGPHALRDLHAVPAAGRQHQAQGALARLQLGLRQDVHQHGRHVGTGRAAAAALDDADEVVSLEHHRPGLHLYGRGPLVACASERRHHPVREGRLVEALDGLRDVACRAPDNVYRILRADGLALPVRQFRHRGVLEG